MPNYEDRKKNIKEEGKKIGNIKLNIFYAIVGKNIDTDSIVKKYNYKTPNDSVRIKGEIGCFLSHKTLLEKINSNYKLNKDHDYTIIFEDDFKIVTDNFEEDVYEIIKNLKLKNIDNFDLIYMGIPYNYDPTDKKIIENIYSHHNDQIHGLYGLLIKNSKIDRILATIQDIDKPIDVKYEEAIKKGELLSYLIYPNIVSIQEFSKTKRSITEQGM